VPLMRSKVQKCRHGLQVELVNLALCVSVPLGSRQRAEAVPEGLPVEVAGLVARRVVIAGVDDLLVRNDPNSHALELEQKIVLSNDLAAGNAVGWPLIAVELRDRHHISLRVKVERHDDVDLLGSVAHAFGVRRGDEDEIGHEKNDQNSETALCLAAHYATFLNSNWYPESHQAGSSLKVLLLRISNYYNIRTI
jgi:hypothetical protein